MGPTDPRRAKSVGSSGRSTESSAASSEPAFEYSRLGDLAFVRVTLQAPDYDSQALIDNYRTHQNGNGLTYDGAVSAYEAAIATNSATLARIIADAGTGVTLGQQVAEHRYEFIASFFRFVPGP